MQGNGIYHKDNLIIRTLLDTVSPRDYPDIVRKAIFFNIIVENWTICSLEISLYSFKTIIIVVAKDVAEAISKLFSIRYFKLQKPQSRFGKITGSNHAIIVAKPGLLRIRDFLPKQNQSWIPLS